MEAIGLLALESLFYGVLIGPWGLFFVGLVPENTRYQEGSHHFGGCG